MLDRKHHVNLIRMGRFLRMPVEDRIKSIEGKIDKLMTNDIPHINERIGRIETNLAWLVKLTSVVLAAVLVGVVQLFLSK